MLVMAKGMQKGFILRKPAAQPIYTPMIWCLKTTLADIKKPAYLFVDYLHIILILQKPEGRPDAHTRSSSWRALQYRLAETP
jgi:hypothetical protein